MAEVLAALSWIAVASVAGLTPNRWHRTIAYGLIAAFPLIAWPVARNQGTLYGVLFLCVALFQLRLLLMHWLRRLSGRGERRE
ncbi:MAG: DUF2484 family protein [Paracoccaceae bacterium]